MNHKLARPLHIAHMSRIMSVYVKSSFKPGIGLQTSCEVTGFLGFSGIFIVFFVLRCRCCRTVGPMVKRTPGAIETALVLRRRLRDTDISEARLCQRG